MGGPDALAVDLAVAVRVGVAVGVGVDVGAEDWGAVVPGVAGALDISGGWVPHPAARPATARHIVTTTD